MSEGEIPKFGLHTARSAEFSESTTDHCNSQQGKCHRLIKDVLQRVIRSMRKLEKIWKTNSPWCATAQGKRCLGIGAKDPQLQVGFSKHTRVFEKKMNIGITSIRCTN